MSVDVLQEKVRKTKNPTMVELCLAPSELPGHILSEEADGAAAYCRFSRELLTGLKGIVPAVRVSFASFALLGAQGLTALTQVLQFAKKEGYYVALDAPEILSPAMSDMVCQTVFGENSPYPCDGLIISGYCGSDGIKPFLTACKKDKKDLYVVVRTANKSAAELQDLLSGSRVVHAAAADHVNRYGGDTIGKFGYSRVGILAAASAADSLRNLRGKYPKLFMLLDGADYPNANAKNCSWKHAESDGTDFILHAQTAAQRMKKNLTRYVTIL